MGYGRPHNLGFRNCEAVIGEWVVKPRVVAGSLTTEVVAVEPQILHSRQSAQCRRDRPCRQEGVHRMKTIRVYGVQYSEAQAATLVLMVCTLIPGKKKLQSELVAKKRQATKE